MVGWMVGNSGGRFTTFPHRRLRCLAAIGAGSAALWKYGKPLVQGIGGIADLGVRGTDRPAAYADICPASGARVVGLGKRKFDWRWGGTGAATDSNVAAAKGLRWAWGLSPRFSQGSDRGIRWGLG